MSISPADLELAVLVDKLNLTSKRLRTILKCYSNLAEGVQDQFKRFIRGHKTSDSSRYIQPECIDSFEPKEKYHQVDLRWLSLLEAFNWDQLNNYKYALEQSLTENAINLIPREDLEKYFPAITDLSPVLYYQGDGQVISQILHQSKKLAIVGSRQPHPYSQKLIDYILEEVRERADLTIVSGLALGVDSLAHQIALKLNLSCLAFVGSGLDKDSFYPYQNFQLKQKIVQRNGLIFSEYPPNYRATPYSFPRRNRLVASISDMVWIVQAGQKSGSLITARQALDMGKTVATTPCSIFEEAFVGNLNLLRDGAQIISSSQDIFDLLDLSMKGQQSKTTKDNPPKEQAEPTSEQTKRPNQSLIQKLSPIEQQVLVHFETGSKSFEELLAGTELSSPELNRVLTSLELQGLIDQTTALDQKSWIMH